MFGSGLGVGVFVFLAKDRSSRLWLLPALPILIIGKYLGDSKRNEDLRECELEEYFMKSNALAGHLKYMEIEIKNYDKL
jgi:hypothetical protein